MSDTLQFKDLGRLGAILDRTVNTLEHFHDLAEERGRIIEAQEREIAALKEQLAQHQPPAREQGHGT